MPSSFVYIFLAVFAAISSRTNGKCSWEACNKWKNGVLNVHIISHSHDDAGWLKNADEYFWGSNNKVALGSVMSTWDTVITELTLDPRRKFSFCESGFFWRWWMMQHDFVRHKVQKLVYDGQLEFIGGGWVQNDEATAHYAAIVDQMTFGLRKLNESFGKCARPKVAWQIDPFGHSKEQAAIFAQMGMKGLFFSRLHYMDHRMRIKNKTMEFLWQGSQDLGSKADIFTSVMFDGYSPPSGFCFDAYCNDDPIMDDDRLEGYNVDEMVSKFLHWCQLVATGYKTNHILIPMGGDFQYSNAALWFNNLDKLMEYVNNKQANGSKVHVFYSTPSCYLKAISEGQGTRTKKTDDFFPYASDVHSYWTGFFTSRPSFKGFIRQTNGILQVCKQLDANAQLGPSDFGDLEVLKKAMGVVQHHDGVSGTAKQNVTYDYEKRLSKGITECQQVVNDAFAKLLPKAKDTPPSQHLCLLSNISICAPSRSSGMFTVTLMNGQSQEVKTTVRIPVSGQHYSVVGPDGSKVQVQIVPSFLPRTQLSVSGASAYEMILPVVIGPLGFSTYHVTKTQARQPEKGKVIIPLFHARKNRMWRVEDYNKELIAPRQVKKQTNSEHTSAAGVSMKNDMIELNFDSAGLLSSFKDVKSGHSVPVKQNFFWYKSAVWGKKTGKQSSGAYIFRPNGTLSTAVTSGPVKIEKISGNLVSEVRQTFSPWVSQVVRLYQGQPYAELEWTVGPISVKDGVGKEIVSRFESTIKSGGVFLTDSNGRQMMQRKRNYQPTYPYQNQEPVAGNYYPVTAHISIKDTNTQMAILTDRSQGGSSLKDGSVELMVHRRTLEDDGLGVAEALNETGADGRGLVVRGRHWLLLSTPAKAHALHRTLAKNMFYSPVAAFAPVSTPFSQYRSKFNTKFAGLTRSLPANVNLMTVEQWQGFSLLIRLEHIFQKNEDPQLSKPVTVNLQGLFSTFDVLSVEEMNLAANEVLQEEVELDTSFLLNRWKSRQDYFKEKTEKSLQITLNPMEIRTFRCAIKPKTQE